MKCSRFALVIIICLLPSVSFGETKDSKSPYIICPDNLENAFSSMMNNLRDGKWIHVDVDACQHIQSEIREKADKIIGSNKFEFYLSLMNLKTMRLVRNTIFALKGYKFEDADLQSHFARFVWYKPVTQKDIILTDEEKRRINLLKRIEDKWPDKRYDSADLPPQPLPEGVRILEKGTETFLNFGKRSLNITPVTHGEGWGEDYFTVHGNRRQNKTIVCKQRRSGDSRSIGKISVYTSEGNLEKEKDIGIVGLHQCPLWSVQRPDILISYNHSGCCGATWDILATFDSNLQTISVLDCGESACKGTSLFTDLNEGNLYMSIAANGRYSRDNSRFTFIDYGGSDGNVSAGMKYINTWSLWAIEDNGSLKQIAEATETVHDKPITSDSWNVIVDTPYPNPDKPEPTSFIQTMLQ